MLAKYYFENTAGNKDNRSYWTKTIDIDTEKNQPRCHQSVSFDTERALKDLKTRIKALESISLKIL